MLEVNAAAVGPLRLQMQPAGSRVCGQTSVAMLLGLPADEVIAHHYGHRRATSGQEHVAVLRRSGAVVAQRFVRTKSGAWPNVDRALVRLRYFESSVPWHHLVAVAGGYIYDPGRGLVSLDDPAPLDTLGYRGCDVRAVSYLEIKT